MDWQQLVKSCHGTHVYLDDTAHRSLHWTLGVGGLVAEGAATIAALSSVPTSTPSSPSPKIITGREEKVTVILGGIVDAASLQSLQAVTSVHTHVAECTIWCAVPPLPEQLVVIVMQPATFNQRNYGVLYFFSFLLNRFSLILLARNSASIFFRKKQQLSG